MGADPPSSTAPTVPGRRLRSMSRPPEQQISRPWLVGERPPRLCLPEPRGPAALRPSPPAPVATRLSWANLSALSLPPPPCLSLPPPPCLSSPPRALRHRQPALRRRAPHRAAVPVGRSLAPAPAARSVAAKTWTSRWGYRSECCPAPAWAPDPAPSARR